MGKRDEKRRLELEKLRAQSEADRDAQHVANGPPKGCGDNSCVVAARPPCGMATNGGCVCELSTIRAALQWYKYEYQRTQKQLQNAAKRGRKAHEKSFQAKEN